MVRQTNGDSPRCYASRTIPIHHLPNTPKGIHTDMWLVLIFLGQLGWSRAAWEQSVFFMLHVNLPVSVLCKCDGFFLYFVIVFFVFNMFNGFTEVLCDNESSSNQSNCSSFGGGSPRKRLEDQIPGLCSVIAFVCGRPGMSARQSEGPISLKREQLRGTEQ